MFEARFTRLFFTILLSFPPLAVAQTLPIYDPMDYSPGPLNSVSGGAWSTEFQGNMPLNVISSPGDDGASLTYSGLTASSGNRLESDWTLDDRGMVWRTFDPVSSPGTAIYASCLVKVIEPPTPFSSVILGFRDPTGTLSTAIVHIRPAATPGFFEIGLQDSGFPSGSIQYLPTQYAVSTSVLVVTRVNFVTGTNNDTSSIWVNPQTALSSAPAPDLSLSAASASDFDVQRLIITTVGIGTIGRVEFDEVRIGQLWTDVTPGIPASSESWALYE